MEKINPMDITFQYGYYGYMILYKGKTIGGAGTLNKSRKSISNLEYFRKMAELTRRDILFGRIRPDMKFLIEKINREVDA
ncbi:MAG: hypothetical protein B6D53_04895 [Candidatus Omnitrophica bacterium 4484_49]|nr:MAG: hypothetical protein B6D53_04895 [Candidatus Omnitrophica bacterium 4484_49]